MPAASSPSIVYTSLPRPAINDTVFELLRQGFDFVDIRVKQERSLASPVELPVADGVTCRMLREDDVPQLLELTGNVIQVSRFFSDRCFDKDKVAEMYRIWARKSYLTDFADAVQVAEVDGRLAGCSTLHLDQLPGQGNIGLTMVAGNAQGRGVGSLLVAQAAHWFRSQGMKQVYIVTQGQNIAAQRMHQACGLPHPQRRTVVSQVVQWLLGYSVPAAIAPRT